MNIFDREIPYYSSDLLARWKRRDGCRPINVTISYSSPPPACTYITKPIQAAEPKSPRPKRDPDLKMLEDIGKIVDSFRENWNRPLSDFFSFKNKNPDSLSDGTTKKDQSIPPFDLQDIPDAMRKIDMPVSAKLMERWFAGELNYSPTPDKEKALINQDGKPYPASMYDTTTIKLEWVLKYPRAKSAFDFLKTRSVLESESAIKELRKILAPWRRPDSQINTSDLRLPELHKQFQYQFANVEGSLEQKLKQYLAREYAYRGIPDDLTGALGSFNFYAAPRTVVYSYDASFAYVHSVTLYIKDNYTFTDGPDEVSQYLGHWNKCGMVLVPYNKIVELLNWKLPTVGAMWFATAVATGNPKKAGNVYYPVWNASYREWQRAHHRGGDFIIFSDYQVVELNPPIEVKF
jgi:hypothetical protein